MKKIALLLALALLAAGGNAFAEAGDAAQPTQEAQQYQTLERGAKGDAVKTLMQRLADLGYYTSSVDASFGPGMARAVKLFNAQNGLGGSEAADAAMQTLAFSDAAQQCTTLAPRITAVALEEYEGKPVFSVQVYNPQESAITFLSVIYRCYDAAGNELYALPGDAASIGAEPRFAKYRDITVDCGESDDLRRVTTFDLSAYAGVARVEAALYCYAAGSGAAVIVPEKNFAWVSSDAAEPATASIGQAELDVFNRTAEQDGLASRFALGAETGYVFAFEAAHYGLPCGIYVKSVAEGGIAAGAGLQAGDVITSIAGVAMDFEEALYLVKAQMEPDTGYALEYSRAGQTASTTISWSAAQN